MEKPGKFYLRTDLNEDLEEQDGLKVLHIGEQVNEILNMTQEIMNFSVSQISQYIDNEFGDHEVIEKLGFVLILIHFLAIKKIIDRNLLTITEDGEIPKELYLQVLEFMKDITVAENHDCDDPDCPTHTNVPSPSNRIH